MAWTYTSDPENNQIDSVRFLCGDTDENDPLMSDSEIGYLIKLKGSPQSAAIEACSRIMAKFAREVDYSIGPESVSASKRFEQYKSLLIELRQQHLASSAFPSWQGVDTELRDDIFDIAMHDAGGIDYGLPDKETKIGRMPTESLD